MTFTTSLKEEIAKHEINSIEARYELMAFLNSVAKFNKDEISLTLENASIARRIYKEIKEIYGVSPNIVIRVQKRFKVKQIYILNVKEKVDFIKKDISVGIKIEVDDLVSDEEKIAFIEGAFLAVGNVSNPSTSGYHLEFIFTKERLAKQVLNLLNYFNLKAKLIKRGYKNIVYIKASEAISDLIKMFKATSSLFYFEDIRIYRDHKNMVNRLNNCEIANQEKTFRTGQVQLENINYLKMHDLFDLLEENTRIVADARVKYPEVSMQELADIVTLENNYKIGKSGVNHHFIKINNLVKRHAADIQPDSILDGSGIRTVIWFQGCLHNCEGCQNPETHDMNSGMVVDIDDIKMKLKNLKYQSGITLSGGDPFFQPEAALEIAKFAKSIGLNVWAYTGFTFDALLNGDKKRRDLLEYVDVLVDGKFMLDKKSLNCKFRGSTNQRLIDVKKSLESGSVILYGI